MMTSEAAVGRKRRRGRHVISASAAATHIGRIMMRRNGVMKVMMLVLLLLLLLLLLRRGVHRGRGCRGRRRRRRRFVALASVRLQHLDHNSSLESLTFYSSQFLYCIIQRFGFFFETIFVCDRTKTPFFRTHTRSYIQTDDRYSGQADLEWFGRRKFRGS